MKPKKRTEQKQEELFKTRLDMLCDPKHELILLSAKINWDSFESEFSQLSLSETGRPFLYVRLLVGLIYLKHIFALSDEEVCLRWRENPYWQSFCGEEFFTHKLPCNPSSLSRWRKYISEAGAEKLLMETLESAQKFEILDKEDFKVLTVDTTVMEKAIAHPTDSKLLCNMIAKLSNQARLESIDLRQSYTRLAPKLSMRIGRLAHAKQFKRMKKSLRTLRAYLGRIIRDIHRKSPTLSSKMSSYLALAQRLFEQKRQGKNKVYSIHAPEVECISKGKSRCPYEFGVKVSIAVTHRHGFVTACRTMPGNPYDGHTLWETLQVSETLTDVRCEEVHVDRGYRGSETYKGAKVLVSGAKRMTESERKRNRRRSAIEPEIGHLKNDGLMRKNWLKGAEGDALHAVLCACGHNIRKILRRLRDFLFLHILLQYFRADFELLME
jgi:IS5 family transposase